MSFTILDSMRDILHSMARKKRLPTPGIDKVNLEKYCDVKATFRKPSPVLKPLGKETIKKAAEKIQDEAFSFSPYEQILINKGKDKPPRVISKPTIRDKIVLYYLLEKIKAAYPNYFNDPRVVVRNVINFVNRNKHPYFASVDISSFFDEIPLKRLIDKLHIEDRLDCKTIALIKKAVHNPTVPSDYTKENHALIKKDKGVPQGLPISNLLAEIYVVDFDEAIKRKIKEMKKENSSLSIEIFRFVDDILMLSNDELSLQLLKKTAEESLQALNLQTNPYKQKAGNLKTGSFTYVGYEFSDEEVTIKPDSLRKMEKRLIEILKETKKNHERQTTDKSADEEKVITTKLLFRMLWRLNIVISGAHIDNKHFGWISYFRFINTVKQLKHLDYILNKKLLPTYLGEGLHDEYKKCLDDKFKDVDAVHHLVDELEDLELHRLKSFVAVFNELRNKSPENYKKILKPDHKLLEREVKGKKLKKMILTEIGDMKVDKYVDYHFRREIFSEIHKLDVKLRQGSS